MTALKEYDRLEASGLWRADPTAQRVEVVVSIGDATLTLTDTAERALAHWSLAAVHRKNPSKRPALYAPSDAADEAEELELSDDDMIAAIEDALGVEAKRNLMPMQPGGVPATWADAELLRTLTGYVPQTDIREGVQRFVAWYRDYYGV